MGAAEDFLYSEDYTGIENFINLLILQQGSNRLFQNSIDIYFIISKIDLHYVNPKLNIPCFLKILFLSLLSLLTFGLNVPSSFTSFRKGDKGH